jgi:hypothetical protein
MSAGRPAGSRSQGSQATVAGKKEKAREKQMKKSDVTVTSPSAASAGASSTASASASAVAISQTPAPSVPPLASFDFDAEQWPAGSLALGLSEKARQHLLHGEENVSMWYMVHIIDLRRRFAELLLQYWGKAYIRTVALLSPYTRRIHA